MPMIRPSASMTTAVLWYRPSARFSKSEATITILCFFAILVNASVLGPGIVSANLKNRWSSTWQKYWLPNSSCVQMTFAPCLAACSMRRDCFARLARKSSEQAICVRPTGTMRAAVALPLPDAGRVVCRFFIASRRTNSRRGCSSETASGASCASPAPLVRHDAVLQLDIRRSGFLFGARAAEDQEDRAGAFLPLRVRVLPDFGIVLTFNARALAGFAERRLHPRGRSFTGLDLIERGVGNELALARLLVGAHHEAAGRQRAKESEEHDNGGSADVRTVHVVFPFDGATRRDTPASPSLAAAISPARLTAAAAACASDLLPVLSAQALPQREPGRSPARARLCRSWGHGARGRR